MAFYSRLWQGECKDSILELVDAKIKVRQAIRAAKEADVAVEAAEPEDDVLA